MTNPRKKSQTICERKEEATLTWIPGSEGIYGFRWNVSWYPFGTDDSDGGDRDVIACRFGRNCWRLHCRFQLEERTSHLLQLASYWRIVECNKEEIDEGAKSSSHEKVVLLPLHDSAMWIMKEETHRNCPGKCRHHQIFCASLRASDQGRDCDAVAQIATGLGEAVEILDELACRT